MSNMKISVYGTANRPQYWKKLYESLSKNDISFEIVFAGPNKPNFELPDNFKFIQTNVKPAQCAEIAYRNTVGEYVMCTADDIAYSEHALDNFCNIFVKEKSDLLIVSGTLFVKGKRVRKEKYYLRLADYNSPLVAAGGVFKKSVRDKLGDIDNMFIGSCWDTDMCMRLYFEGGKVIFLHNVICNELRHSQRRLWSKSGDIDLQYLYSCWIKHNGKVAKTRLKPITPFIDKDILKYSQGRNLKEYWD